MEGPSPASGGFAAKAVAAYATAVKALVLAMTAVAGAGVLAMMCVTVADVVLRAFRRPLTGAFDIVSIAGAVVLACSLPYTTAVKGHVAIEFFFHKLGRKGRIAVDALTRLVACAFFGMLCRQAVLYGRGLRASGEVTPTLQVPKFWVAYVVALSCAATMLVIVGHILRPGRELIKP